MQKIKLSEDDIYKGNLILVNSKNLLKSDSNIETLEPFSLEFKDILLNKEANEQLHKALKFIKSENKIVPVSGYRSLSEQTELFNSSLKENGEEFTYRYVALPNASEHQTGLAIDLGLNLPEIDFIRPSFPHEGITEEFRHIAPQFGFIERYQKIKQNITLIDAEEWHFRYVTYPHSKIITERGLCLEEYIELLKHESLKYQDYEITYIKYQEDLEIDSENIISISGNNQDGFIITKKLINKRK